jgi:hypothetical protein
MGHSLAEQREYMKGGSAETVQTVEIPTLNIIEYE